MAEPITSAKVVQDVMKNQFGPDIVDTVMSETEGAHTVLISGSLIAGLGNSRSDLDVYVVNDSRSARITQIMADSYVQYSWLTRSEVLRLAEDMVAVRFEDIARIGLSRLDLYSRLCNGVILTGSIDWVGEHGGPLFDRDRACELVAVWAQAHAEAALARAECATSVDQRRATALLRAAAGFLVMALCAHAGDSYASLKWNYEKLARAPISTEVVASLIDAQRVTRPYEVYATRARAMIESRLRRMKRYDWSIQWPSTEMEVLASPNGQLAIALDSDTVCRVTEDQNTALDRLRKARNGRSADRREGVHDSWYVRAQMSLLSWELAAVRSGLSTMVAHEGRLIGSEADLTMALGFPEWRRDWVHEVAPRLIGLASSAYDLEGAELSSQWGLVSGASRGILVYAVRHWLSIRGVRVASSWDFDTDWFFAIARLESLNPELADRAWDLYLNPVDNLESSLALAEQIREFVAKMLFDGVFPKARDLYQDAERLVTARDELLRRRDITIEESSE